MLKFEPITLGKQKKYLEYLDKTEEKSADYTFINLFGLKDIYSLEWAFTKDLVWIKQSSPYTILWAPVGNWDNIDNISNILCQSKTKSIIRIPKTLALKLDERTGISIAEMRDEWEYLYDRQELIDLKGNRFHKKKNLYNQFNKLYNFEYHSIDISWIDKLREFEKKWYENEVQNMPKHEKEEENFDTKKIVSHEVRAEADMTMINTIFDNWNSIVGIRGGVLTVDGRIAAYTMGCSALVDTLVVHTERADREFKGAYQAINKSFLMNDDSPCQIINREQDVGDLGLRKAKMSYNPIRFVEKYSAYCDIT